MVLLAHEWRGRVVGRFGRSGGHVVPALMRKRPDQHREAGRGAWTGLVGEVAALERARKRLGGVMVCAGSLAASAPLRVVARQT